MLNLLGLNAPYQMQDGVSFATIYPPGVFHVDRLGVNAK